MKAKVQNIECYVMLWCAIIKFSCMHQRIHQRVFLMAGLHVKCGGVWFPILYHNWNTGAG